MNNKYTKIPCTLHWTIHEVNLKQKQKGNFELEWARGSHKGQTDRIPCDDNFKVNYEAHFEIPCTMFVHKDDQSIRAKQLKITLKRFVEKQLPKVYGKLTLDIGKYYARQMEMQASNENQPPQPIKEEIEMETGRSIAPVLSSTFNIEQVGKIEIGDVDQNDISYAGGTVDKMRTAIDDWDVTENEFNTNKEESTHHSKHSHSGKKKDKSKKKSKKNKDKDKESTTDLTKNDNEGEKQDLEDKYYSSGEKIQTAATTISATPQDKAIEKETSDKDSKEGNKSSDSKDQKIESENEADKDKKSESETDADKDKKSDKKKDSENETDADKEKKASKKSKKKKDRRKTLEKKEEKAKNDNEEANANKEDSAPNTEEAAASKEETSSNADDTTTNKEESAKTESKSDEEKGEAKSGEKKKKKKSRKSESGKKKSKKSKSTDEDKKSQEADADESAGSSVAADSDNKEEAEKEDSKASERAVTVNEDEEKEKEENNEKEKEENEDKEVKEENGEQEEKKGQETQEKKSKKKKKDKKSKKEKEEKETEKEMKTKDKEEKAEVAEVKEEVEEEKEEKEKEEQEQKEKEEQDQEAKEEQEQKEKEEQEQKEKEEQEQKAKEEQEQKEKEEQEQKEKEEKEQKEKEEQEQKEKEEQKAKEEQEQKEKEEQEQKAKGEQEQKAKDEQEQKEKEEKERKSKEEQDQKDEEEEEEDKTENPEVLERSSGSNLNLNAYSESTSTSATLSSNAAIATQALDENSSPKDMIEAVTNKSWNVSNVDSYITDDDQLPFPPCVFPLYATLLQTHSLFDYSTSDEQESVNKERLEVLDYFADCYEDAPLCERCTPQQSMLTSLFLVLLSDTQKGVKYLRDKKQKGIVLIDNSKYFRSKMEVFIEKSVDNFLNPILQKFEVLINRFITAKFEMDPLLNDFKHVFRTMQNQLSFSKGINKMLMDLLLAKLEHRMIMKLISNPMRFMFTNAIVWNSFMSALLGDERIELNTLREVVFVLIMANGIADDPSLKNDIAPHIEPKVVLYIMKNYHPDIMLPQPIKVDNFVTHFFSCTKEEAFREIETEKVPEVPCAVTLKNYKDDIKDGLDLDDWNKTTVNENTRKNYKWLERFAKNDNK